MITKGLLLSGFLVNEAKRAWASSEVIEWLGSIISSHWYLSSTQIIDKPLDLSLFVPDSNNLRSPILLGKYFNCHFSLVTLCIL